MNKAHSPINWENYPEKTTPINEGNLNKMDRAIGIIDDRVIEHEHNKLSKTDASSDIVNVEYNEDTSVFKFTKRNGDYVSVDVSSVVVREGYTKEESDNRYANAIKRTYSGETIVATDSSQAKFEGLRVFGRSEQVSTTGKNLFDEKQKEAGTILPENGIEVVDSNFYRTPYLPITAGVHTFSAKGTFTVIARFYWYDSDKNFLGISEIIQDSLEVPENASYYRARWKASDDVTEIMLNKGDQALPYEPYSGGYASPSPEYPQPIESIGDDGSVDVGVYGKSLLENKATSKTINGVTFTVNDDGSVTVNGTETSGSSTYITISDNVIAPDLRDRLLNKSLILSGCPSGGGSSTYDVRLFNANAKNDMLLDTGKGIAFTFTNETELFNIAVAVRGNATVNNVTFYPMIRIDSITDGTYEPYTKQSLSVSTLNGLPAIKVADASLATYTDAEGVMWVADEIDFARGKYVQRIGIIDNFSSLNSKGLIQHTGYKRAIFELPLAMKVGFVPSNSTHFIKNLDTNVSNLDIGLDYFSIRYHVNWENVRLLIGVVDELANITDCVAYLNELKVKFQYILAEPIETDLTAEQLEAYRLLHSNYPTTTILNDENAHVEATLVADTKNHIEQNYVPLESYKSLEARVLAVEQALA